MFLNKAIYTFGAKRRNPTLFKQYNDLKASESYTREQLEDLQLKKLHKLLSIAYEKTEYYKKIFDERGLKPEDIKTLSDLEKLPTLEKKDILKHSNEMRNYDCGKVIYSETSGSTGEPMVFYKNNEWDTAGRAAQMRGYSWYGVHPWDKNGYLWGHLYGSKVEIKTRILDFLVNRFRLFSYKENDIKSFAKKLKSATYIEGYSSMIYEVAKTVNKHALGPFNLKLVKGTSEKIYDSYQDEVRKAFGTKMVSEYGAAETTLIAFECPCGNMHVVMENVIVESRGGVFYVTNLNSFSMPIIRYKIGDQVILNREKKCACGMQHEIIEDVVGRIGKNIYGKNEKYPSLTLYYIFKSVAIKTGCAINYQGIQKEKGKLEFILERETTESEKNSIIQECKLYFKEDVDVYIRPELLVRDHTKKFQDFVQYIK